MATWSVDVELRGKFQHEYTVEADTEQEADRKAEDLAFADAYIGEHCDWDGDMASAEMISEDEDELEDEDDLEEGTDA